MPVPFVDLATQHHRIRGELLTAVGEVLDRGDFILGESVARFEERFAALCGVRHAVALATGTDAIALALRALGIGPGDEVVTVPNSFVTTAAAIALVGARPVFVDVRDDYNLDPDQLESAIGPRTRAVLPVHLTGRPADMGPILEIALRRGVAVVEDAAQAVAAEYRGRPVGSFGALGCFSLHPLKTLGACGDGGAVTTDDEALASRVRVLRNNGLRDRDTATDWSANSRLDTIQAAILLVKLGHLDEWTEARRSNARRYQEGLRDIDGLRVPVDRPEERAVYHTFVVQAERRDALRAFLSERGIGSGVHYPIPIHLQPAARELGYGPGSFPVAEAQAARIVSLPVHSELSPDQVDEVIDGIRAFYAGG